MLTLDIMTSATLIKLSSLYRSCTHKTSSYYMSTFIYDFSWSYKLTDDHLGMTTYTYYNKDAEEDDTPVSGTQGKRVGQKWDTASGVNHFICPSTV